MREVDIPDETNYYEQHRPLNNSSFSEVQNERENDDSAELEREIRAAREIKRTGKERLNDGAKRRIEMLIGMTRTTRSINIGNNVYVFQSLKAKEFREAIIIAARFDGTVESTLEIRKQFLARSLIQIAGVDIDQFIGSTKMEDRLSFIEEFEILSNEAKDKYSIKTEVEVKEVVEDLKK